MSKLNRFLISESISDSIPDARVTVLDQVWSDHNPVMFHVSKVDYGPIPFKFFHSWLHPNDLDEVIKSGYFNAPDFSFHSKLKSLKQCVKDWHLNIKHNERSRKHEISSLLKEIEIKLDAGASEFNVSHFFFADDVVIVTEWSNHDMDNLKQVLHVFDLASGLKINMHKSNVFGVGVPKEDVVAYGSWNSWSHLVSKFNDKLSNWKANLLSIGGRLNPIKAVLGSVGIYHMSIFKLPKTTIRTLERIRASFFWGGGEDRKKMAWVKWDSVLASLDKGGLGVGSLKAFNLALLLKWHWRFVNNLNALWSRLIKATHGEQAGFDFKRCKTQGIWDKIVSSINHLHSTRVIPHGSFKLKVGDGFTVRFWKDTWLGDSPLEARYNKLFHLDSHPNCFISDRFVNDSWQWSWCRQSLGGNNNNSLSLLLNDLHGFQLGSGSDF
uniref:RNA-directed DNA polymerase, eukaryota, reverse transcriptase zinc-binding domain protein n=1 Tax=Tanacetum cinerariifolium TaxID=118510 RepID=A0A6L2J8A0_TANCI|nr:RNA-directed DNA polymerase, eukaryota, reverse transcriptase zinc-binding domain protein [Tanacetum cinerariifolium]